MSHCGEDSASSRDSSISCLATHSSPQTAAASLPVTAQLKCTASSLSTDFNPSMTDRTGQTKQASSLRARSCLSCRRRKVRCDREQPCSTCWRLRVPCAYPLGRAPRPTPLGNPGARSEATSQSKDELIGRIKKLEDSIRKLGGSIDVIPGIKPASASSSERAACKTQPNLSTDPPGLFSDVITSEQDPGEVILVSDEGAPTTTQKIHDTFGRLVLHKQSGGKRYTSHGFWANLDDELTAIRQESHQCNDDDFDDSDYDSIHENATPDPASIARHPYIFGYRYVNIDLSMCLPEPFQVPYLWSIYQENVEPLIKAIHIPTMNTVIREARKNFDKLSVGYQALVWAIYYAAVASLDPEDVLSTLGQSKDEALASYRFAVQQALSMADFLTTSNILVLQALTIFLTLRKDQDESRTGWSMTGLAVHLARGMGLHRDGGHLTLGHYEMEVRRRLWWGLLQLDLRFAEELGTDLIIGGSTFDTHMPSNINDADISPEMSESPLPREGRSDTTLFLIRCEICHLSRKIIEAAATSATVEEQKTMLVEVHQQVDGKFFKWLDEADPLYDIAALLSRTVRAKVYLAIYQPVLFAQNATRNDLSDEAGQCVYWAAINLLEYNHLLSVDPQCQQYRWIFQTYSNLHATAYFLIESCRRPWTPLVERGWQALHGYKEHNTDYTQSLAYQSVVMPIKKLWLRAGKHRAMELARLSQNLEEAHKLDLSERTAPVVFPFGQDLGSDDRIMHTFRARWNTMIRAGNSAGPTGNTESQCLLQPVSSCVRLQAQRVTDLDNSVDIELCDSAKDLPSTEPCQYSGSQPRVLRSQNIVGCSELDNTVAGGIGGAGRNGNEMTSHESERDIGMNPQQGTFHPYPLPWLGPFPTAAMGFDELENADVDTLGDDFDWQDWVRSLQDLEAK